MLKAALCLPALAMLALAGCAPTSTPTTQNGVVLTAAPASQPGENTGAGAIAGMVLLGAAGGSVGSGVGQAVAITAGAIAGASAGTALEAANQPRDGVAYTVQLSNGQVVTLIQHLDDGDHLLAPGAKVTVQTNGDDQKVLPRQF